MGPPGRQLEFICTSFSVVTRLYGALQYFMVMFSQGGWPFCPPPHSGDNGNVWGYYRLWQVEEREEDAVCIWWGGAREMEEDGVCIWWVGARGPRSKYCILHVTVSCNNHLSPNINTDTLAKPSSQTQWWRAGLSGISFHSLQPFLTSGCARHPTNMLRSVVWGWRQDSPCPQRTSSFVGSPWGSLKKETCAFKRLLFT